MVVLVSISTLIGCMNQSESHSDTIEKTYTAPAADTEGTLKILTASHERVAFDVAKAKFKAKYHNVEVEITSYAEDAADTTELEKLHMRQMTGDGADILLMEDYGYAKVCDFNKVQQAGAFVDLAQYFDRDPGWDWSGYSQAVVNGMKQGNKLYCLPLYYNLPVLVTSDTLLDQSSVNVRKCNTGIGLLQELAKCAENAKASDSGYRTTDVGQWYEFQDVFDVDPVTFRDGKAEVKWTKNFEKTLQAYDEAGQANGWFVDNQIYSQVYDKSYYERLMAFKTYFVISGSSAETYEGIKSIALMGQKPQMIPVYTADGSGIAAQAKATVSIATGCKNPALAYEFIKCLLSEDAQAMQVSDNTGGGYDLIFTQPINKDAVSRFVADKKFINETVTDALDREEQISYTAYVDQYTRLADKVVHTYMTSQYYENTADYFMPYFWRVKSLENCYEDAETQLEIYATE